MNSTSNHNIWENIELVRALYIIWILHQTTTLSLNEPSRISCILYEFYIKPQRRSFKYYKASRCILYEFYIKPQHEIELTPEVIVVYYMNSTSNHNYLCRNSLTQFVVYYMNSTSNHNERCFKFIDQEVVYYMNSTSNHNLSHR